MKLRLNSSNFGKIFVAVTALLASQTSAWAAKKCLFTFSWKNGLAGINLGSMLGACPTSAPASALICSCGFDLSTAGTNNGVFAYTDCTAPGYGDRDHRHFQNGDYDIKEYGSSVCELVDRP